ncbi:MAG: MBL fold metallo-hydrolase [Deltaproteobacteria bacterium]|nr:MBL fold metallo-hydrolase [Deltaproteobacteria bacterium]
MIVKTFPVGPFQCNCTILGDPETGEAIVIDPGDEADRILKELKKNSLTAKHLLHTHAHLDHIGATRKVHDATSGKVCLHKEDLFLYDNIAMQGEFLGLRIDPKVSVVDHYLNHRDVLEWGKENRTEILHTPGHTPGSVSFVFKKLIRDQDVLFSGDTLFFGSIGRTDLWGGDYDQIIDSIKTHLLTFDDSTVVVCGHGPNTSIGQERRKNPFLV